LYVIIIPYNPLLPGSASHYIQIISFSGYFRRIYLLKAMRFMLFFYFSRREAGYNSRSGVNSDGR